MKQFLSYLSIILIFTGCFEPKEKTPILPINQEITANIDGKAFKAIKTPENSSDFEHIQTSLVIFSNQRGFVLFFAGLDLTWENAAAVDIGLVLSGPDFASLKAGTVFENRGTDTEPSFGTYSSAGNSSMVLLDEEVAYSAVTDDFGEIEIVVTAIDHEAKRISGTFEFTAVDPDENRTVVVTGGEFKNISWEE